VGVRLLTLLIRPQGERNECGSAAVRRAGYGRDLAESGVACPALKTRCHDPWRTGGGMPVVGAPYGDDSGAWLAWPEDGDG
jgi:hypothetical protein